MLLRFCAAACAPVITETATGTCLQRFGAAARGDGDFLEPALSGLRLNPRASAACCVSEAERGLRDRGEAEKQRA